MQPLSVCVSVATSEGELPQTVLGTGGDSWLCRPATPPTPILGEVSGSVLGCHPGGGVAVSQGFPISETGKEMST